MVVTFRCVCRKKLQVRSELVSKKVKCPHCQKVMVVPRPKDTTSRPSPTEPKLDLLPIEGEESIQSEKQTKQCPQCGAPLYKGDVVCTACGQGLSLDIPPEEKWPFYKQPIFRLAIGIVSLLAIFLVVYFNFFAGNGTEEKDLVEQPSQEELLENAVKTGSLADPDNYIGQLNQTGSSALPLLIKYADSANKKTRVKALYGINVLSYFGIYDQAVYAVLDKNVRHSDIEVRRLTLQSLYFMSAGRTINDKFIDEAGVFRKHQENFNWNEDVQPLGQARISLLRFSGDRNDLIKMKADICLVLLGDTTKLARLFKFLKNPDESVRKQTREFIFYATGRKFEKYDQSLAWWEKARFLTPVDWYISALKELKDPERLQVIDRLIETTGQDFCYDSKDSEDKKQSVIKQWQKWSSGKK